MNEFSKLLFSLRKEKGFTQTELADKIGVSNKAVSKWETGESYPETAQLIALSNLFNITIDELLKGKKEEQSKISEERKEDVKTKGFFDRIFTKKSNAEYYTKPMIIKMIAGISLVFLSVAAFILMYSFEINYAISVPIMLAGIAVSMLLLAETGLVIECLRAKLTDEELEKTKKYKWMIIFGLILAIISPSAIVSLYQYTHFGIYLAVFFTVLIPAVGLLIGGGMMWEKLVEVKIKK